MHNKQALWKDTQFGMTARLTYTDCYVINNPCFCINSYFVARLNGHIYWRCARLEAAAFHVKAIKHLHDLLRF